MANIIERTLPKTYRERLQFAIWSALGLFLGLRYNDFLRDVIERYVPETNGFIGRGLILILTTIVVVFIGVQISKGLDGK